MADDLNVIGENARNGVDALLELAGSIDVSNAPPHNTRVFIIGWGLLANLVRQACAVRLLQRNGFGHEAAPNRRLMIETMAWLKFLAVSGEEAVDSMNLGRKYTLAKLRTVIDDSGRYRYDDTAARAMDTVEATEVNQSPTNQYLLRKNLLAQFAPGFTELWMAETELSHPSLTGARSFFDDSHPDAIEILDSPDYGVEDPYVARDVMCYLTLHAGVEAFNEIMTKRPWTEDLRRIAAETGLPTLK